MEPWAWPAYQGTSIPAHKQIALLGWRMRSCSCPHSGRSGCRGEDPHSGSTRAQATPLLELGHKHHLSCFYFVPFQSQSHFSKMAVVLESITQKKIKAWERNCNREQKFLHKLLVWICPKKHFDHHYCLSAPNWSGKLSCQGNYLGSVNQTAGKHPTSSKPPQKLVLICNTTEGPSDRKRMKSTKRGTSSCKSRCGPSDHPPEMHWQNRAVKLPLVLFYKHSFTLEIGKFKQYQIETLSLSRKQSISAWCRF